MSPSNTIPSLSGLGRLVRTRERFENEWNTGGGPRIETYLDEAVREERGPLLRELLVAELQLRVREGERPSQDVYLGRFPHDASVVEAAFNALAFPDLTVLVREPGTVRDEGGGSAAGSRPASGSDVTVDSPAPSSGARDGRLGSGEEAIVSEDDPAKIGRYRVIRRLGEGSFGRVYLARDEDLKRFVAIKVPRRLTFGSTRAEELFLNESRMAARLRHPGIIAVHDIGRQPDGGIYIVLEYVDGRPLSELLQGGGFPLEGWIGLLASIAEAVHHAHVHGLVHRDLKPANILVDSQDKPRVADFGLAIHDEFQKWSAGEVAGTVAFMAPEQVQGETHRLDGRTDVWALGVVLYEMLASCRPFSGPNKELMDDIQFVDPKPPRQIVAAIPEELERICLKCLSKRMTDRYGSALGLAEDLRAWLRAARSSVVDGLAPTAAPRRDEATRLGPKGLRAFDGLDAELFANLLPGPRDRDGLPEPIAFWKSRIEDRGGATAFSVGLLYGPSGSGKSSMVKAGILPRLDGRARVIYLEASPEQTEAQLAAALRRGFPSLPAGLGLVEALAAIRQGEMVPAGPKVLLVLDQFEQWLQAHPDEPRADLVRALRQCDGRRLQALLLVRDDFWMAITRLFRALEIPLVEGANSAQVELFDPAHARKVLIEFGSACQRFTEGPAGRGPEVSRFLHQAIEEMTGPDGRVMPVRLSLFAEMVRRRPWTSATLREVGGVEGIGVTFLKEAFDLRSSPPRYRLHRKAAHSVLQALLPVPTSVLRGGLRSGRELIEAAGYAGQPDDFADLRRILDTELRLITPIDPDGTPEAHPAPALEPGETYYQLAHDFLVGPIRQWVEEEHRATRSGRAKRRLANITASWVDQPSSRRLPSLLEWAGILQYVRPGAWSVPERRMMRTASRYHLVRVAAALIAIVVVSFVFKNVHDGERAEALLERALKADYRNLPALLPELAVDQGRLRDRLERLEGGASTTDRDREIAALLLYRDRPRPERAQLLRARPRDAGPDEVALVRDALATHPLEAGVPELKGELFDKSGDGAARLRVACVLAGLGPEAAGDWGPSAVPLTEALLVEDRSTVPRWLELLGPATSLLVPVLGHVCGDEQRDSTTRSAAAESLAELLAAHDDTAELARSVIEARPEAALVLLRKLEKQNHRAPALAYLQDVVAEPPGRREGNELASRQARAAIVMAVLGEPADLRSSLRHRADPRLRTEAIHAIATLGLAPRVLDDRFPQADLGPSERQAVLMAWAETPGERLTASVEDRVAGTAHALWVNDPDPGVHSAAELLLRRWGRGELAPAPRESPARGDGRRWELGPNGHTMVVLPGPLEFVMGPPDDEPDRFSYENRHYRRIDRSLAVATTEVTVEQYRAFEPNYEPDPRYVRVPGCPASRVSWYDGMRYCNWLSQQAHIERDQWCYPDKIEPPLVLPADLLERTGFRLPTEAEWEYFGRAGTEARWSYGDSEKLLSRYGWSWLNSRGIAAPAGQLLPNEFGLFDTIGSLWEWCHDGPEGNEYYPLYPKGTIDHPAPDPFHGVPQSKKDWRIVRGGAFDVTPAMTRSAHRDIFYSTSLRYYNGIRVVRTLPRAKDH